MIETKEPQLIDARSGQNEIVYFDIISEIRDNTNDTRVIVFQTKVKIAEATEKDPAQFEVIGEDYYAVFKDSTYLALFGDMTLNEFEAAKPLTMISQIAYINTYDWKGDELSSPVKFWNLTENDMKASSN